MNRELFYLISITVAAGLGLCAGYLLGWFVGGSAPRCAYCERRISKRVLPAHCSSLCEQLASDEDERPS